MMPLALIPFFLAFCWPALAVGLVAAAVPAYLIRFTVFGLPTTLLELGVYGLVLGLVVHCAARRTLRATLAGVVRTIKPYWIGTAAMLLSVGLATVFAADTRTALGALKAWYVDAMLFAVAALMLRGQARGHLIGGLAVGSTALSLWGLWEYFFRHASLEDGRLNSVFGTPNYHALLVVPVMVLLLGSVMRERDRRWWFSVAFGINLIALFFTFSYGGYLGLTAGIFALVVADRRLRRWAVMGAVILAILALTQIRTDKFRRLSDFTGRSSTHSRVQIWRASWYIIERHPIVGVGPNNFEPAYREAIPHIAFPPLEWLVALPHNLVLAILAQTGVLGLAAFVWLLIQFFRVSRRAGPAGVISSAAMIALLVHGLVDTPYFKNDLAPVFWLLMILSLWRWGDSEEATSALATAEE